MTEPFAPLSDEDLSAALDGMAGPDVDARIQADPSARARLDVLRSASETFGRVPAPSLDATTVDALITRAIEVGTASPGDATPSSAPQTLPGEVVTPLAPRHRSSAGIQRWLVAAVIVALVAIGLGLVYSGTHNDPSETAAIGAQEDRSAARLDTPESAADGAIGDDASSESTGIEPEFDASAQKPATLDQLGSFADTSALRTELRAGFPTDSTLVVGDRPSNVSVDRCTDFIQTILGDTSLAPEPDEVGYARVDGAPYLVYEFSVTGSSTLGSKLITAAEPQSCDLLFTFVR